MKFFEEEFHNNLSYVSIIISLHLISCAVSVYEGFFFCYFFSFAFLRFIRIPLAVALVFAILP